MNAENYDEFQEMLRKKMPDEGLIFTEKPVYKVNQELTGIFVKSREEQASDSIFYMQKLHEAYEQGESLAQIVEVMKEYAELAPQKGDQVGTFLSDDSWKQYVIAEVINTERNEAFLKTLPHRKFYDLSIIYRIEFPNGSVIISRDLMERYDLTEPKLYALAKENIARDHPLLVSMDGDPLYAISNKENRYGANAFLFPEKFAEIAEILKDDLYILPSSIHELLFVRASLFSGEEEALLEIVRDANEISVSIEDFLSNTVYFYERKEVEFDLMTERQRRRKSPLFLLQDRILGERK